MKIAIKGLYLVTDTELCHQASRSVEDVVASAMKGGTTIVQLRDKEMPDSEFLALAWRVKRITDGYHGMLIINDRVNIATDVAADGVHVGQDDMAAEQVRALLGPGAIVGLSVETMEQAQKALALPHGTIDYLGVSPVFWTPTKTDFQHCNQPWGLEGLRKLRALSPLPLVAIGGIHLNNAQEIIAAGADSLAVVSALCSVKDPKETAMAFAGMFP